MLTGPFGVVTSTRRKAGWAASPAMSRTKPKAMLASNRHDCACAAVRLRSAPRDQIIDKGPVGDARIVARAARVPRQTLLLEHMRAEIGPFAFVLDSDQDVTAIFQ